MAIVAAAAIDLVLAAPVNYAQQSRDEVDGEDVVRIEEETDAGDKNSSDIYTGVSSCGSPRKDKETPGNIVR